MNQNPYVENLIQKGYSERECRETAFTGRSKQFPYTIHGKTYQTQEEYDEALSEFLNGCLLYTSPSPRDATLSRMPSSA